MTVYKEALYRLVDRLNEQDEKAAIDFLEFLIQRSKNKPESWEMIDTSEPDHDPLCTDEWEQLNSDEEYVSGEDGKREFGLQVDLP